LIKDGFELAGYPAVNAAGEVYFKDLTGGPLWKIDRNGKVSAFVKDSEANLGKAFGPDGKAVRVDVARQHPGH